MTKQKKSLILWIFLLCFLLFPGCGRESGVHSPSLSSEKEEKSDEVFDLENIPEYSGSPYIQVNGNVPLFTEEELTDSSYESYSDLDSLGRCGVCIASVGQDLMPTEERGAIGSVKPSGWHIQKYAGLVDGNYLYNRCHLIGYQLTGENANEKNLITGTRYMNVEGMLPFENMVADYVKETDNHVLYRATPVFKGDNLVADGVLLEGESVEDKGEGILFFVYCYNVQPGIAICYEDGSSKLENTLSNGSSRSYGSKGADFKSDSSVPAEKGSYVVNGKNGKIHIDGRCSATSGSSPMGNPVYFDTYEEAEEYSRLAAPGLDKRQCGNCW